jgi:hypothetical protein
VALQGFQPQPVQQPDHQFNNFHQHQQQNGGYIYDASRANPAAAAATASTVHPQQPDGIVVADPNSVAELNKRNVSVAGGGQVAGQQGHNFEILNFAFLKKLNQR